MDWIAALDFEKIANAIIILLVGVLTAFGFRDGKRAASVPSPEAAPHIEIAGALVDASSVKILAGAIEGHSLALAETRAQGRDVAAAVGHVTESLERVSQELSDVTDQLRELRQEMSFSRKG